MNGSTIGLIITGVIALILLISVLWGVKRGLKKSLFRLVWIFVCTVILFFTVNPLSNWLNSFDLSSLNLDIGGKIRKLSDIGVNVVKSLGITEEVLADNPALKSLANNLPTIVLNILLFVIAFWLIKAVLWPVWALISSLIFDKQKRLEKKQKKEFKKNLKEKNKTGIDLPKEESIPQILSTKTNKHRGWGALVGFVMGLLVCAVTFSPLVGINSIFQTVYSSVTVEKDGETVPYLSTVIDKQTLEYINCYNNSIGSKLLNYTGVGVVSKTMFDSLASVEVDNKKVYLTDEINVFINVYNNVIVLQSFDLQNASQQSIDEAIRAVRKIFIDSEGSQILYLLGDELVPYFLDQFLEQENITIIDGDFIDQFLIQAYRNTVDFALKEFKDEISSVVEIIAELNNKNLIAPFISGEASTFEETVTLIGTNVVNAEEFATHIVDNIYKINIFESEYANLAENGISKLFKSLNIEYEDQTINSEDIKNGLQNILQNSVKVCQAYVKAGNIDFGDQVNTSAYSMGSVVDYLKTNILTVKNYNSIVDYLVTMLNDLTSNFADFSDIIQNLNNVESWKEELVSLSNLYSAIMKIANSDITIDKIADGETKLIENIGKGLQSAVVGESKLVNNKNIRLALEEILTKFALSEEVDMALNIKIEGETNLKEYILNNIYSNNKSKIVDWNKEAKYTIDAFVEVYNLVKNGFDANTLSQTTDEQLAKVGKAIDDAMLNTHLALTNKALRNVLEFYINKADLNDNVNEILDFIYEEETGTTIFNGALNKIYNNQLQTSSTIKFEQELPLIKNLVSTTFDVKNLSSLGNLLDKITSGNLISKDMINPYIINYANKKTSSLSQDVKTLVEPFITSLESNLKNVDSYEQELVYVQQIFEVVDIDWSTIDDYSQVLTNLGNAFNNCIDSNGSAGKTSVLFTKDTFTQFINNFCDYFVTDTATTTTKTINLIKSNAGNIQDYAKEFGYILNIVDYEDENSDGEKTFADIGYLFDKSSDSQLFTPQVINQIICIFVEDVLKDDSQEVKNIVQNINTLLNQEQNLSYEQELLKLESLNISTSDYVSTGKSIDQILSNNSKIIQRQIVNQFISYYINKVADEEITSQNDANLKQAVKSISQNVEKVISFETEFSILNTLLSLTDLSDINEIGSTLDEILESNSKLILKENITAIVEHFFDNEVEELNLNPTTQSGLIELINDIKDNIKNIESYQTEFSNLELLTKDINSAELTTIGTTLNTLKQSNSKLITKDNITAMVEYFYDQEVEKLNLNSTTQSRLIEIINNIKTHIKNIEDYQIEFDNLILLTGDIDSSNLTEMGATLNSLKQANGKLVTPDDITDIVKYFFDEEVNSLNLDSTEDASLISVINDIKQNISQIEDYQTEFSNLELLTKDINSAKLTTIGANLDTLKASNSKLITAENITLLVQSFYDEEVEKLNLSPVEDAGLIKVINDIKANIVNIESYEFEFENLETLTSNLNSSNLTEIGEQLDTIKNSNSKLITADNIVDVVKCFFDKEVESLNLDQTKQSQLIEIINNIKANIDNIESYKKEFENLNLLTQSINASSLTEIGKKLDTLNASNSKLITSSDITAIVEYFFDEKVEKLNLNEQTQSGLIEIIKNIKSHLADIESYEQEFESLELLTQNINSTNLTTVGETLSALKEKNGKLITPADITNMVEYFFDDKVDKLNLDESTQSELILIIDNVRGNLVNIEDYKKEFTNLDLLTKGINASNLSDVGAKLDLIKQSNSKLITTDNITDMVEYFYDEKVAELNLNQTTQAGLITIINNIKGNVSDIENYQKEFNCLEILTNNINSTSLTAIGTTLNTIKQSNSKLITSNDITDIVNYFYDEEISKLNLNVNDDAQLIEIINDIKSNIANIVDYKKEFNNLELLTESINTSSFVQVGLMLDTINESNSNLITSNNISDIVAYFFDEEIAKLNLDESADSNLIDIIADIKLNIESIENYELEFTNLDRLTSNLKNSDLIVVGQDLDKIKATNSKLITQQKIKDIVLYFFDRQSNDYVEDYSSTISTMRTKIESATSYESTFEELDEVMGYLEAYSTLSTVDDFKNAENLGNDLDTMASMTLACDKEITKSLATQIFDRINEALLQKENGDVYVNQMHNLLNGEEYSFDSYCTPSYAGTHADQNYYADLMQDAIYLLNLID